MGNFHHNLEVLKKEVADLSIVRRSHHAKVVEDYLPCLKCYGFFEMSKLWRHVSQCKAWINEKTCHLPVDETTGKAADTLKKDYREMSLVNLIDPSLFDELLIVSARSICGSSGQKTIAGVKMLDSPSYGLHIGHTLV
ncbi:hypothetical protein HOLleu_39118 [Holothuria leucospilota]|uniref:Uncharacterized protein n=1 Tax=Holothuria leucospilota TaxID=206669 RepID=A0A9Q0YFK4_HOLLE|nr:hypothetical protein HOLleu_39118 [Holothuria leucospilota]